MRPALLILLACAAAAAERQLAWDAVPRDGKPLVLAEDASLIADRPTTLAVPVTFAEAGPDGIETMVVARCLRAVREDDWRTSQKAAGRRRQERIDHAATAFGTPAERKAWGIAGSDRDWDSFSVQWDGRLAVPVDGIELATASDDGSRLWIDRDGDGRCSAGEWGDNGWGGGQGATQRVVAANLPAGIRQFRLQYEDGGGGNACSLRWKLPGKSWETVPASAFAPRPTLHLGGAITCAARFSGRGRVILGDGVILAGPPLPVETVVAGKVRLAADIDLGPAVFAGGRLACAGRSLRLGATSGSGSIDLEGGMLALAPGSHGLALGGPGRVEIDGQATVASLDDTVEVVRGGVCSPQRSMVVAIPAAPLATVVPVTESVAGDGPAALRVDITVPPEADGELGLAAWRADRDGAWWQRLQPQPLAAGRSRHAIDLGQGLVPEGHRGGWSPVAAGDAGRIGLLLYATRPLRQPVAMTVRRLPLVVEARSPRLLDLRPGPRRVATGSRWELAVRPDPYPADPTDPESFALDCEVERPDGSTVRYAGFHHQPVVARDGGDRETYAPDGPPRFTVRLRATVPGRHRLRLVARWAGQEPVSVELPDLEANGSACDRIARPDAQDPRFFSAEGRLVWPAGCNLHSNFDTRAHGVLKSVLNPDRGSATRMALLERLAAGGGSGCEMWLSPWNLGLEWNRSWPGYRGAGRYHDGHAWALDRVLDRAEALGMHINLSLFNHGQGRAGPGAEEDWELHAYARDQGGWLDAPAQLFTDARAFAYQRRLFRYLGARWGDSPAVLGWKLWAEVNLVQAPVDTVVDWHRRAAEALAAADPWRHPITTHWCGDWNSANRDIAGLPGIGYITIDAYKGDKRAIADLLCRSTRDPRFPRDGLSGLGKPVLVTEFGGSAGATSRPRMAVEHAVGPWAALVSGHAGSPMLWWFEWIDQEDRFGVYGAVNRFLAGEDLRGSEARCVAPAVEGGLWCRVWLRPGRGLGYLLDEGWGRGEPERTIPAAAVRMNEVRPGAMSVEWWDADRGRVLERREIAHPGGTLTLVPPAFARHLAFKLMRRD